MDGQWIDRAECAGPLPSFTAGSFFRVRQQNASTCVSVPIVRDLSAQHCHGYAQKLTAAINDVMCRLSRRQALWALALLCTLAPSHADGNIGCLFSASLCVEGVEWCYDDFAFGKCILIYDEEPEDGSLYKYDLNSEQLQWFEGELQRLAARGYRWEHAYTQCVLQAMLYTLRQDMDPAEVNTKLCEQFVDPKLNSGQFEEGDDNVEEIEPDETAFVRFTPNSALTDSDFANEIYNPPFNDDDELTPYIIAKDDDDLPSTDGETPSDKLRDLMMMSTNEDSPVILPFEGFRERIQAEKARTRDLDDVPNVVIDKEKKSLPEDTGKQHEPNAYADEERLGVHFRKYKTKPPPYTAEYITENRFSPLDAEVRSNALEKYKQSFAEKNFPFEYENSDIPEQRIYIDEDGLEEIPFDTGSGESDPYHLKDPNSLDPKPSKNMEYLMNYWREIVDSKLKPQGALYAEGGPLKADDLQGENSKFYPEEFQDLLNNEWGFKRRERDDVKKPGPRLDAKTLKILYHNKSVTAHGSDNAQKPGNSGDHDHNDYDYDPSYAYVLFKNRFLTNWEKGISFIARLEEMLGLEKHTFTNPRVDLGEVTFKVEKNSKGYNAEDVARRVDDIKEELRRETGAQVLSTGVGDRSKRPVIRHMETPETLFLGIDLPLLLALVGSLSVLIVAAIVFTVMLKYDFKAKRKMQGLSGAAEIDAEATRDYQELCRARMSGKWSGQQTTAAPPNPTEVPQRITSLSREPDGNSPSTRSSTSSWSEEPALTNMDISTGHMVLAYMEDHLRNKDRLEQEWRALCAYEAEPCATTAALKPENTGKNRYADVLPYDHSRVTLNTLSNHLGSDYINASTITDHDPRNPAYIAAAGPLAHTAPDFWQMVWEQGSVVMVMLTRLTENGQQLCHRYWPEEGSELYHIYEVHLVSEHIWCDDYLVRSFYLKNQRTGETRTVTQFHFLSWPENGVPASTKALLEFRRKVNKSYRGRSCPIVVHCSDGAGRSGTYCLIDMVLNRMAKGAKEIDIAATLEHIRDQRPRTVATKQQFEFVLMAVAEEVHAILKALPAHLQQLQEKKDKEKEKEKDGNNKEKPNN
ncbi:receptor-type tyrosine-protein phosphatase N2 isoform X2 [Galleria mellonella]|uniref:Receptor-type tyrosine-protein phosphatase N2 isoform X2 n=1 Tax=Galleria mellonella TaxID=7137 RepID=A0A6J1WRB3_GALME|nr:receptor-type tyrosine-protein phosphatase N2 isoform X2 [Galleria mellonella]